MNIAVDCRMAARTKSGIGYYVQHLVEALLRLDTEDEFTLFTLPGGDEALPRAVNAWSRALRFPNPLHTRLFRDGGLPNRWSRAASRRYALVHETAYEPLPVARCSVLTIHDLILFRQSEYSPAVTARYQRRIQESARAATLILADSEHTRRDILELLDVPPEKVLAVPLGVAPEAFSAVAEAEAADTLRALGIHAPYLFSIGDLYRRKNNIVLVHAFACLPEELRRTHQLVIAGAAKDQDVTRELHEAIDSLHLQDAVRMTGYVSHAARRVLMARARLLCYPSRYEGFGLPPLEAMAAGVPVAASDNSSLPEVVGDAGWLVQDFEAPEAWADAMTRLLTEENLRADLAAKGLARARLFTWERAARMTLTAYRQAIL